MRAFVDARFSLSSYGHTFGPGITSLDLVQCRCTSSGTSRVNVEAAVVCSNSAIPGNSDVLISAGILLGTISAYHIPKNPTCHIIPAGAVQPWMR